MGSGNLKVRIGKEGPFVWRNFFEEYWSSVIPYFIFKQFFVVFLLFFRLVTVFRHRHIHLTFVEEDTLKKCHWEDSSITGSKFQAPKVKPILLRLASVFRLYNESL